MTSSNNQGLVLSWIAEKAVGISEAKAPQISKNLASVVTQAAAEVSAILNRTNKACVKMLISYPLMMSQTLACAINQRHEIQLKHKKITKEELYHSSNKRLKEEVYNVAIRGRELREFIFFPVHTDT